MEKKNVNKRKQKKQNETKNKKSRKYKDNNLTFSQNTVASSVCARERAHRRR